MKNITLAYLAGVMDSDGFFTIKRNTQSMRKHKDSKNPTYQERVGLKQVQPEAVELIYSLFGGYRSIQKPSAKNGKPLHSIGLSCKKAVVFIEAVLPYLLLKKKQAQILIELRKSIEQGKKGTHQSIGKTRWGTSAEFKRPCVSQEQINFRENLIKQLNGLNDIRAIKDVWRK
jgi:hypothetical protein